LFLYKIEAHEVNHNSYGNSNLQNSSEDASITPERRHCCIDKIRDNGISQLLITVCQDYFILNGLQYQRLATEPSPNPSQALSNADLAETRIPWFENEDSESQLEKV